MEASAWAMNGATSNMPSSQPFRSTRCGVTRFLSFGFTAGGIRAAPQRPPVSSYAGPRPLGCCLYTLKTRKRPDS